MPNGLISENVLKSVGDSIGHYVKSDLANFDGMWKSYVRIRVAMNVEKPLKRRSSFCFVCGIVGHSERECNVVYANPDKIV